jgi:alpha-1,6-mannosyltransferase
MAQAAESRIQNRPSPSALRAGPAGRHLVDVTMLFSPTSGGIRRYLLAKHGWLRRHTRIKHTILVPGARDAGLRYDVITLASPALPLHGRYRVPVRTRALRERLARLTPDLIEVGDPYHVAWQALDVARRRSVPTVAFCHSDLIALADFWLGTAGVRNVAIQPLGVDAKMARPQMRDPGLRVSLGIAPDARLLVFAGRMSPEKRIRDLMAAASLLGSPYHLLLIGGRRRRALAPNVTLLEYQQDAHELARILASCDAFVHAGDQETFGLVALEAMACGLPVVAARAGALEELVDESVGETFRARDLRDLVLAIDRLFERDLAALGRAARQRAESHSWDAAFTQLIGHYWRLMSSSGAGLSEVRRVG